jgi:hypothetical protein
MVSNEWNTISQGNTPMEVWQNKIRHLHDFLRGWARNHSSVYKKEKQRLLDIIDVLDIKDKSTPLTSTETEALHLANDNLAKLHRDEESKWAQRAKVKHIQKGVIIVSISI